MTPELSRYFARIMQLPKIVMLHPDEKVALIEAMQRAKHKRDLPKRFLALIQDAK